MSALDLLIVVVYGITLIIVALNAMNNMEDWAVLQFDKDSLKQQLVDQNLDKDLVINFNLKPQYKFEPISDLALAIINNSDMPIYVDWDHSTLTNFAGRSRRVIRLTPSTNVDLSRPQVFSVISPGRTLNERIVAEDMLKAGPDGVKVGAPLVDLDAARALPEDKALEFFLRLLFRVVETERDGDTDMGSRAVLCRFMVRRVPWNQGMPWPMRR